jgi:nucleotide-binding universal stress UspA family protein
MKEELPELDEIDLKIEKRVGSPVSTILEMEKDHKRDLILMGSHEGKFTKFLLGSVAENIARYAKSSVWVLREKPL